MSPREAGANEAIYEILWCRADWGDVGTGHGGRRSGAGDHEETPEMNAHSEALHQAVARAAATVRGTPGLEAVVWFGSGPLGRAASGSDCDLALVGTKAGCRKGRKMLPPTLAGAPVDVVELTPENGYGHMDTCGHIGHEVAWTGVVLWGGERMDALRGQEPKRLAAQDVATRQVMTLEKLENAVRSWNKYRRRGNPAELLRLVAESTQEAAEHVLKGFMHYRGVPYGYHHNLKLLGEQARKDPDQAVLFDDPAEKAVAEIRKLGGALNGHGARDHKAAYVEEPPPREAEARLGRRLAVALKTAYEENERVKRTPGMESVAAEVADSEAGLREVVAELKPDVLPGMSQAGGEWRQEQEPGNERGDNADAEEGQGGGQRHQEQEDPAQRG